MSGLWSVLVTISCLTWLLTVAVSCAKETDNFNSSLFWSYYQSPGAVERAGVSQGAYERSSPALWSGPGLQRVSNPNNEVNSRIGKDYILQLGEFVKISHGPRRRRESSNLQNGTVSLPGPTLLRLPGGAVAPQFRRYETPHYVGAGQSGGFVWPIKYSQANIEQQPAAQPEGVTEPATTAPKPLPRALLRSIAAAPTPLCRHYCGPVPSSTPCCQPSYPYHTAGPLVQPTLIENWVSGIFEFGAQNPVVFAFGKSLAVIGLLSIVLIAWALVGEWLGFAEIPRARISLPSSDSDGGKDLSLERFVVDVVGGHWLEALEDHVAGSSRLAEEVSSFLCCVYKGEERLECLPRARAGQPGGGQEQEEDQLTCLSNRIYDIALNLKTLKNKKRPLKEP